MSKTSESRERVWRANRREAVNSVLSSYLYFVAGGIFLAYGVGAMQEAERLKRRGRAMRVSWAICDAMAAQVGEHDRDAEASKA